MSDVAYLEGFSEILAIFNGVFKMVKYNSTYKTHIKDPVVSNKVLFFRENRFSLDSNMRNSLNRGINYLAENFESIKGEEDPYTLAMVCILFSKLRVL